MNLFNQIISGKGLKGFAWEVAIYGGNDETETIGYYDTYLEALIFKLRHKTPEKLFIDLWRYNESNTPPDLIGTNFMQIRNYLENNSQNICTS